MRVDKTIDIPLVILAGGKGTRLQSTLPNTPKLLAPIGSDNFLVFLLNWLQRQKVKHCIFSLGHLSEQIIEALEPLISHYQMDIKYSIESMPSGTLGGLSQTLTEHNIDESLVMNGDTFVDVNLYDFVQSQQLNSNDMALICTYVEDISRYGSIKFRDQHRVESFLEKCPDDRSPGWINAGIYYFSDRTTQQIKTFQQGSIETDFLQKKVGTLSCFKSANSTFIDIGTPESYRQADKVLKDYF